MRVEEHLREGGKQGRRREGGKERRRETRRARPHNQGGVPGDEPTPRLRAGNKAPPPPSLPPSLPRLLTAPARALPPTALPAAVPGLSVPPGPCHRRHLPRCPPAVAAGSGRHVAALRRAAQPRGRGGRSAAAGFVLLPAVLCCPREAPGVPCLFPGDLGDFPILK